MQILVAGIIPMPVVAAHENAVNSTPRKSTPVPPENAAAFSTTHWSVIVNAANDDAEVSVAALEKLCRIYWYPLYAFARRRGCGPEEAEDLCQGFFERLIQKEYLKTVGPEKGRFRSFLLTGFTNFSNNERGKQRAQKRGGSNLIVSWDEVDAEQRYLHEPAAGVTPEKLFDRRWAFSVVEQVLLQLRREYTAGGKLPVFEELEASLTQEAEPGVLAAAARRLQMSEGALNVALHRLRRRFGERLRAEVASTVVAPDEVEEELRYLVAALSS